MSKAHFIAPTVPLADAQAVRLGTTGAKFSQQDVGKFVKLTGESQYDLCAVGDAVEGIVVAVETATSGGFSIGSVVKRGTFFAVADGLQGTPGTGTLVVGDIVLTGTVTAKGTALPAGFARVVKATDAAAARATGFALRVVSLGTAGTGAAGSVVAVERLV